MFNSDSDIFVTRIENPTDKPFCHRGIAKYPVIPAKGYIDVRGVYTKIFRDEWFKRALDAGIRFRLFSIMPCKQVKALDALPAIDMALPQRAAADADAIAAPDEALITMPVKDTDEPPTAVEPFRKAAQAAKETIEKAEKEDGVLRPMMPSGVVRHDDLMQAESERTVNDSELFRRSTAKPDALVAAEAAQTPVAEAAPVAATIAEVGDTLAKQQQARPQSKDQPQTQKSGKKRNWLGA